MMVVISKDKMLHDMVEEDQICISNALPNMNQFTTSIAKIAPEPL